MNGLAAEDERQAPSQLARWRRGIGGALRFALDVALPPL
jgi:hypothetical protein